MIFEHFDPPRDAEAYYEDQERAYDRASRRAYCQNCGRPCGAESHYNLWGDLIACSKDCALELMDEDDKRAVLEEWIDTQTELLDGDTDEERW